MTWTPARLPDQSGRTFVVTGGNSGIGYFTAEQLASTGAHVVLACRDTRKAGLAAMSIRGQVRGASLDVLELDVASLESVFAEKFLNFIVAEVIHHHQTIAQTGSVPTQH